MTGDLKVGQFPCGPSLYRGPAAKRVGWTSHKCLPVFCKNILTLPEDQTFCCIDFAKLFFPFFWICFPFVRTTLCRLRIKRVVDSILSIAANGPVKNTLHSTGHKATLRQREKGEVAQKGQRRDWCVEGGFTVSTSSHTLRRRCSVLRHGPLGLQHCLEPARHAPDHLRDRLGVVLVHPIDGVPHPGPEGL